VFEITLANGAAWAAALVFVAGAIGNGIAPPAMRSAYERWGYPDWFHYVTAAVELVAAVMIFFPATRVAGAALGGLVMGAALWTVLHNREFSHAAGPIVIGALCGLAGWLAL